MENIYIDRPVWSPAIRTRRAEVWHWRYCSAWDLASIIDGERVTETEYNAALALLDSVQRYALADAAEWERENSSERSCNSAYHAQREKQLDARRERLKKRLERYGYCNRSAADDARLYADAARMPELSRYGQDNQDSLQKL